MEKPPVVKSSLRKDATVRTKLRKRHVTAHTSRPMPRFQNQSTHAGWERIGLGVITVKHQVSACLFMERFTESPVMAETPNKQKTMRPNVLGLNPENSESARKQGLRGQRVKESV